MNSDRLRRAQLFIRKIATDDQLESIRNNVVMEFGGLEGLSPVPHDDVVKRTAEKLLGNKELLPDEQFALEAIIIPDKRPVVDVIDDNFDISDPLWSQFSSDPLMKGNIQATLPSIGRIEVSGIPNLPYGGTGFVVSDDLLMTNRHVAELFSQGLGVKGLIFRTGVSSGIDFKQEQGGTAGELFKVSRVLMIHPYWDMALLQVDGLSEKHPALTLSMNDPNELDGHDIAIVGYPGFDPRNPADVQNKVFHSEYYVKRLQPGKVGKRRDVLSFGHNVSAVTHDASTLGGNSGSAVIDPRTGHVVALHFSGVYLDANFAVPSSELARDDHVLRAGVKFQRAAAADSAITQKWWQSVETEAPTNPTPT